MSKSNETRFLDSEGHLTQWPSKHKDQLLVLAYLATKFDYDTSYTEPEVNELLKQWHTFGDWPLLRRELFDRDFMDRDPDGSNYHLQELPTDLPGLVLVRPNIAKDAQLAVNWMAGPAGRETLRLMGNSEKDNHPSTLEEEQQRLRDFTTATNQITWMMRYQGRSVGAVWINLESSEHQQAPSIDIMIGDPAVRGQGIGTAAINSFIEQFKRTHPDEYLYSRHLMENAGSAKLLKNSGFTKDGQSYQDEDGLRFQNVKLNLKPKP
jgi:predicted GNAT family N-acyltransferase